MVYSLLGVQYGPRVQTDLFHVCEHDCITVGSHVVFGFNVVVCPADQYETKQVILENHSNVRVCKYDTTSSVV